MVNSTQANVLYSNELFKQYIMQLSNGLVWKNTTEANSKESTDLTDLYLIEIFVTANRGLLNFDIIKSFPRSILLNAGIPESNIEMYAADKTKIPENYRKAVVDTYQEALKSVNPDTGYPAFYNNITQSYETIYSESNDYYRKLMGLPNKDDKNFIYNTDLNWKPKSINAWTTRAPIHELPLIYRYEMEDDGILDSLLQKYPDKEYIAHLGRKGIDPFRARVADRFELLYYKETESEPLNRDFTDTYSSARQLMLTVYYNKSLNSSNALYENFLAMCILFITIQTMQHKYLKVDITRDFYDIESLKLIYDSYGVPFYNDIPLEYHRKIVKNINKLISYKGSSQVFFDLFDIFDIGSIDIYSYFLTKTHIMDSTGKPSFIIKQKKDNSGKLIYDDEGNPVYEYDDEGNPILDESNYKIQFSRTKIYNDPALAISDEANSTEYKFLTEQDPYWVHDEELMKKLSDEDFNYLESKYIGIQTVFDLMKLTYENAYAFRMITDNKEYTDRLKFKWADIDIECSLFDAFIYLAALYCRERGYTGIIRSSEDDLLHGIPAIMDTLGYNFESAVQIVKETISKNPNIKNANNIILIINDISINKEDSINSINTSYENIRKLQNVLIDGYLNASSIEEYHAYRQLYKALMISKEVEDIYTGIKKDESGKIVYDDNGNPVKEVYETFVDVLSDTSAELMQRYMLLDDSEIDSEMTIVINQLESLLDNLKYMSMSVGAGNSYLIDSLFKILTFFKSAKSELVGYNIVYTITMRGLNFFKMLDKLKGYIEDGKVYDYNDFTDMMGIVSSILSHKKDIIKISEKISDLSTKTYLREYLISLDTILVKSSDIIEYIFKDYTWYIDFMHAAKTQIKISSEMLLEDISNPELIHLEILESRYFGTITDTISRLTDVIYEDPKVIKIYEITELMQSIDSLRSIIETSKTRNCILKTTLNSIDESKLFDLCSFVKDSTIVEDNLFNTSTSTHSTFDIFKFSSELKSGNIDTKGYLKSLKNLYDKLCEITSLEFIISKSDYIDKVSELSLKTILDKSNSIRDVIRYVEYLQYLEHDSQSTIDTSEIYTNLSNQKDLSSFSDCIFEHDSNGEKVPLE